MKKILLFILTAGIYFTSYSQTVVQLKEIAKARQALAASDYVYPYLDTPPGYVGGDEKWLKYQMTSTVLKDALKKAEDDNIPEGMYIINVKFVVNADGTISQVKTTGKPVGYGLEEAVVEFIKGSGKWLAANVEGKEARSVVNLPITFKISYD